MLVVPYVNNWPQSTETVEIKDLQNYIAFYIKRCICSMAIWDVEFSNGVYKIRKFFAQEASCSKEIIEF